MNIYIHTVTYRYTHFITSRWYLGNYVRIVCQGGDHSKKVILTHQNIICEVAVENKTVPISQVSLV